ncbi:hypothetical protein H1C71_014662, partial [Ictidomys tridecemlineatus]
GTWQHPVAYLSKQLDSVAQGWPPFLRALAATALLVLEADKLAMRQELVVRVPHSILTLLKYKGHYWLTNEKMVKYQDMLCENPHIHVEVLRTPNPATLLPIGPGKPDHKCVEVMDEVFSGRSDLTDQPLEDADAEYFTDGSSFIKDGVCFAGYAVVTLDSTVEAKLLPQGTSTQKVKLIALIQAPQLTAGVCVDIYIDSKYAFTTLHVHRALCN